jgi:ppGpp synthetase/RelA/SpoT-type nucleotidyltranferase
MRYIFFKDEGKEFFNIIKNINEYNIALRYPTMRKSIENFKVDEIYDEVLNFVYESDEKILELSEYLNIIESKSINVFSRIKSEQSFRQKWEKNLGKGKQLREVCNDIVGIRIIADLNREEIKENIEFIIQNLEYNISIVDFYENPKRKDDGYRGVHIYFKENPKCFPIEIQIWNQEDALLNFYTHDIIYKRLRDADMTGYSYELRNWIDDIPKAPEGVEVEFIKYLYKFVYADQGGE